MITVLIFTNIISILFIYKLIKVIKKEQRMLVQVLKEQKNESK